MKLMNFKNKEKIIEIITINKIDLFVYDFESICALLKNLDLFVTVPSIPVIVQLI